MFEVAKHIIEVLKKAGRPLDAAEIRLVLIGVHGLSVDQQAVNRCLKKIENTLVKKDSQGRWSLAPKDAILRGGSIAVADLAASGRARWRWGLCRECGHKTKVERLDLSHSSPPRCSACGGVLELSEAGREEYAESIDHARQSAEQLRRKQGFRK